MSEKAKAALKVIADAAKKTSDGFVVSVSLPVSSSDEREEVCKELITLGCISHVSYHGRKKVQCQLEQNACDYLNE